MNTLDLIERYLQAVGRQLPLKNRNDILAELRSNLSDMLEGRTQGEPSEDDIVKVLKEFGAPEKVAASYYPEGQYLVGPALFPSYRTSVGLTLLVVVIVHLVLIGVTVIFAGDFKAALNIAGNFLGVVFTALGVLTLVFYILQRTGVHGDTQAKEWDPHDLPEVDSSQEMKRGELIADIVFSTVFLTIFLALKDGIKIVSTPGGESWTVVNPVLNQYLALIVISLAIGIGVDIYLLWRARWTFGARLAKIASNLISLGVLGVLIAGHQAWLEPYTGGQFLGVLERLPDITSNPDQFFQLLVMQGFWIGLVVAFIVETVETVVMGFRLVKQAIESR